MKYLEYFNKLNKLDREYFVKMLININEILSSYRDDNEINLSIINPKNMGYYTNIYYDVEKSLKYSTFVHWKYVVIEISLPINGNLISKDYELLVSIKNRLDMEYSIFEIYSGQDETAFSAKKMPKIYSNKLKIY